MDLRHQFAIIRSWLKTILAATALAGLASFVLSTYVLPKVYEAESRLLVGQALQTSNPNVDLFQAAQNLTQTYAELATTRQVVKAVMADVGLDMQIHEFDKKISVAADQQQPIISIIGNDADPIVATAIANAMADQLLAIAPSLSSQSSDALAFVERDLKAIQTQIEQAQEEIATLVAIGNRTNSQQVRLETLQNRLVSLRSTYAAFLAFAGTPSSNRLTVIDRAVAPDGPASPRPLFNTAIGLVLGLLVGIGFAFLWERLDDRVKNAEDVERATGLTTIGTVLRMPTDPARKEFYRLVTLLYPRSPAAEAFRSLRTNLEFSSLDERFRTIVVTSSVPGEGKTVVASNLAVAFAQSGRSTILVDADLRRPGTHLIFSLANDRGLTDMLRSDETGLSDVAQRTEEPNLTVITSGTLPANPAELVGSHRMEVIIDRLAESADLVIFDTPPIGAVTDAALLAARASATILVVQPHRAREHVVVHAREALANVSAHVVGVVLNNIPTRDSGANPYFGVYRADELPGAGDVTPVTPSDRRALERPPAESPASGGSSRTTGGARR